MVATVAFSAEEEDCWLVCQSGIAEWKIGFSKKRRRRGNGGREGRKTLAERISLARGAGYQKSAKKKGKAIGTFEFSFPGISPLSMRENQARKEPWPLFSETLFSDRVEKNMLCQLQEGGREIF